MTRRIWMLAAASLGACQGQTGPSAERLFAADALFTEDLRFRGADDAYSVNLGGGRVLWLFGDTFVALSEGGGRESSRMVRNTVAVQEGYDPRSAEITFYWNEADGEPAAFFPGEGEVGHWPGDGERLGDSLLIFLMNVRTTEEALGFSVEGSTPALIENPDDAPSSWRYRYLEPPPAPEGVVVGSGSVMVIGDYVYAYSAEEGASHDVYLARWPLTEAQRGELSRPEWFSGAAGFVSGQGARPAPVFAEGQTEFTVHFEEQLGKLLLVETRGFGATTIGLRTADRPEGPWSESVEVFRPPESDRDGTLVYAAKAHPELSGDGLLLTYVANAFDFFELFLDESLYFPRFVRVTF